MRNQKIDVFFDIDETKFDQLTPYQFSELAFFHYRSSLALKAFFGQPLNCGRHLVKHLHINIFLISCFFTWFFLAASKVIANSAFIQLISKIGEVSLAFLLIVLSLTIVFSTLDQSLLHQPLLLLCHLRHGQRYPLMKSKVFHHLTHLESK